MFNYRVLLNMFFFEGGSRPSVFLEKVSFRLWEILKKDRGRILKRCQNEVVSWQAFVNCIDEKLHQETEVYIKDFESGLERMGHNNDGNVRGGGNYGLCYFLCRHIAPDAALETGVAVGFTSRAILSALKKNDNGLLFSSDLPYFRSIGAKTRIGLLVEPSLRDRWKLFIEGDSVNFQLIKKLTPKIDFFHYDSDKTYIGRARSFKQLSQLLKDCIVVMDDVQDNSFFFDYVEKNSYDYLIFEFNGKYMGIFSTGLGPFNDWKIAMESV